MYCTSCGQLVEQGAGFCTSCGEATGAGTAQPAVGLVQPLTSGIPPRATRTSGLAVAALVLGILWIFWLGSGLAIIFGHISLAQMKKDPDLGGRGMALAGLILGYIGLATFLFLILLGASIGSGT
jgi:Domain of unknown function (DUF4190)